jgi:hypothetical protein
MGRRTILSSLLVVSLASGLEVATITGDVLSTYGAFQFTSLDGTLFAGSRHTRRSEAVIAFDASTGERLFRVRDAFAPVVLAHGRKVGFMPDRFGHRDPYFSSVWIRNSTGRARQVVRFAGPGRTVNPRDFEGEGIPLDQAWDAAGRTLAVTFGNDVDLFIYDVWVVDVRAGEATRVSRGHRSRFPSLSPNGDRLALVREVSVCGDSDLRRAGDLAVMNADGTDRVVLLEGSCDLYYTDPRWISEDELVAVRIEQVAFDVFENDLVRIDATTGDVTELVATGDISFLSVSAELQKIAYHRSTDTTGFRVYDLATATSTEFATGVIPNLVGTHRLV